jgi:hypothetical protein
MTGNRDSEWRSKDGREWHIGSELDASWVDENESPVAFGCTLPRVFDAYATLELEGSGNGEAMDYSASEAHDDNVLRILRAHTAAQPWWLGYLDTGSSDVVFYDAPRAELYAGWGYVLVEAGPAQAKTWRGLDWKGYLPDLIFPADRSWLVTTLWDDDWTCIGGTRGLVQAFKVDPELGSRVHEVDASMKSAVPPGHVAF